MLQRGKLLLALLKLCPHPLEMVKLFYVPLLVESLDGIDFASSSIKNFLLLDEQLLICYQLFLTLLPIRLASLLKLGANQHALQVCTLLEFEVSLLV
jgi:hypothetical protein